MRAIKRNSATGMRQAIGPATIGLFALLLAVAAALPQSAYAENAVDVRIESVPPMPAAVRTELEDIFSDTLAQVLFEGDGAEQMRTLDGGQIAEAIRTGINIVIEPRGYSVAALDLQLDLIPVPANFLVHPVGWTSEDPHAVADVAAVLAPDMLDPFWIDRLTNRLRENEARVLQAYREHLLGLPAEAVDSEWALDLVTPGLIEGDPASDIFPGFAVTRTIDLGRTARVTIMLAPELDLIELVRPRMYSFTLYNIILDRFREVLLAEADFIEGMPRSEIDAAADEIESRLEEALTEDVLADQFRAYASVTVQTLPDTPVVMVDALVESRTFDLRLETFVDFGNESKDSSEVQARFGFLIARGIEAFVNLNYFTNDSTLETDLALGLRPTRGTFAAIAYDLEREGPKYFFEQEISPGFHFRGEIFQDDALNELGVTYQFQQYLSAGMYTNGDNEYWMRAIFAL